MGGVFKVRRKLLANSQLQVGKQGNVADQMQFGTAVGDFLSTGCLTMSTGSFVVANANAGDMVFLMAGSLPANIFIASACVTAASTITASFYNTGSGSATGVGITVNYLLISAS